MYFNQTELKNIKIFSLQENIKPESKINIDFSYDEIKYKF